MTHSILYNSNFLLTMSQDIWVMRMYVFVFIKCKLLYSKYFLIWIVFVQNHSGAVHSIKYSACCGCWEFSAYFTKVCQRSGNGIYVSHVSVVHIVLLQYVIVILMISFNVSDSSTKRSIQDSRTYQGAGYDAYPG